MYGLHGSVNPGRQTYAVGYFQKNPFLVYASGSSVIALTRDLKWIQTISSASAGLLDQFTTCVDCSTYGGKIAVVWDNTFAIYKPQIKALVEETCEESFPFEWHLDILLNFESKFACIKWNAAGSQLITANQELAVWEAAEEDRERGTDKWVRVWRREVASQIDMISYTTDGTLFATCSENDCLVKVWYQRPPGFKEDKSSSYVFAYINHPQPVRGFQWRATAPLLPPGYVPNVLMTCCEDNFCRIWSHKMGNEGDRYYNNLRFHLSGIIDCKADNLVRSTNSVGTAPFIAHWLNNKSITFLQKATKAVKSYSRLASRSSSQLSLNSTSGQSLQDRSQKDSEDISDDGSNVEEDRPSSIASFASRFASNVGSRRPSLNPLSEFFRSTQPAPSAPPDNSSWLVVPSPAKSKLVGVGRYALPKHLFDNLVETWRDGSDMVFAIHPVSGSLLLWTIDGLDFPSYSVRVVNISFTSCIPHAISPFVAQTLWSKAPTITYDGLYQMPDLDLEVGEVSMPVPDAGASLDTQPAASNNSWFLGLVTCHARGSIDTWSIEQSTLSSNSSISGLIHMGSADGHHGTVDVISPHPRLPVIATYSGRHPLGEIPSSLAERELTLWQYSPDSVAECKHPFNFLAHLSFDGPQSSKFVWFPVVFASNAQHSQLPHATLLGVQQDSDLVILSISVFGQMSASVNFSFQRKNISCASKFGEQGVELLATIPGVFDSDKEVRFIHAFQGSSIEVSSSSGSDACALYLVVLEEDSQCAMLKMWRIECTGYQCEAEPQLVASQESTALPMSGSWLQSSYVFTSRRKVEQQIVSQLVSSYRLPVPPGCEITRALPASDTLNSNSSCFPCGEDNIPPLLLFTVLSNGVCIGWQCVGTAASNKGECQPQEDVRDSAAFEYVWTPYLSRNPNALSNALSIDPVRDLCLQCTGKSCTPLAIAVTTSCSVAMVHSDSAERPCGELGGNSQLVVSVWECESTGGLSWNLDGCFRLDSLKQLPVTSSRQVAVHLEWIPVNNGRFLLGTSVDHMLYVHGPVSSSEHKLDRKWVLFTQIPLCLTSVLDSPSMLCSLGYGLILYSVHNEIRTLNVLSEPHSSDGQTSLAQVARKASISCPQYHPYYLTELLNAGRMKAAKAILQHLLQVLNRLDFDSFEDDSEGSEDFATDDESESKATNWVDLLKSKPTADLYIPSLPLSDLELLTPEKPFSLPEDNDVSEEEQDLFADFGIADYNLDLELSNSSTTDLQGSDWSIKHSDLLKKVLQHVRLPSLTTFEQVQLMSLSQTVATTRTTIAKDTVQSQSVGRSDGSLHFREGIDECAFRYILALTNCGLFHEMLSKSSHEVQLGLTSQDFIWAFHSDAEQDLLSSLPCMQPGRQLAWEELRDTGIGWWLRNHETLTNVVEKLAKSLFAVRQEPLDAALFYLAMKKKSLMKALFRTVKNTRMQEFFSHDFTEERWHKAALKNAFALLTKQRFQEAAAFFLLGNSLHDAVEVCLHKLNDIQLAVVVARMYEGREGGLEYNSILSGSVGRKSTDTDELQAEPVEDRFVQSMAYWLLGEYSQSLETLLVSCSADEDAICSGIDPSVFHIYFYLRNHPIMLKRKYGSGHGGKLRSLSSVGDESLTTHERLLVFKTAKYFIRHGLPSLAVDILSKVPAHMTPALGDTDGEQNTQSTLSYGQYRTGGAAILSGLLSAETAEKDRAIEEPSQEKVVLAQGSQLTNPEPGDTVSHGNGGDEDMFDWGRPVLMQADRLDTMSDSLELELDLAKSSLSSSSSSGSPAASEGRRAARAGRSSNYDVGLHALAKHVRCRLSFLLMCFELESLVERHSNMLSLKTSLTKWLNSDVQGLCSFCCGRNPGEAESAGVLEALIRYCNLHSCDVPKLQIACSELMRHFQPSLGAAGDGSHALPSPSAAKGRAHPECVLQPSGVPLLSATLLPIAHPYSVAKHLKMLVNQLVNHLLAVPNPPSESLHYNALDDLQNLSQNLTDLSELISDVLYCNLASLQDSLPSDLDSSLQSTISASLDMTTESPPISGKKSKKKVTFSFDNEPTVFKPNSQPSKWPGMANWPSLLPSEDGRDPQGLCVLLVECIVPVYLALVARAWLRQDPATLLLLLKNPLSFQLWCDVCGGAYEVKPSSRGQGPKKAGRPGGWKGKLRSDASAPEVMVDRSVHGFFIPPKLTLVSYLHRDPPVKDSPEGRPGEGDTVSEEALDFAWHLVNLGAVRLIQKMVHDFVALAGIDVMELSSQSASLNKCCKVLETWQDGILSALESCKDHNPFEGKHPLGPGKGPSLLKHKSLLDPKNSPFNGHLELAGAQKLWIFLLHNEVIREGTFIKYIFKGKEVFDRGDATSLVNRQRMDCLLYKAKESDGGISSMCVGETSSSYIAVALSKEIVELDVADAWKSEAYMEDIENSLLNETPTLHTKMSDEFVLVHSSPRTVPMDLSSGVTPLQQALLSSTTSGATQMLYRSSPGVKRLCSHPVLPYYLAGDSEGHVVMYEFGNRTPLFAPSKTSMGGSITRIHYAPQGSKFAASDSHGYIFMWKGLQTSQKPYATLHCHSKGTNDFAYMASSSLIAAAGDASENRNVTIIDTLMPAGRSSIVKEYTCHEAGASAVAYSPKRYCIITGGKKGYVCVLDVRQHSLLRSFQAHSGQITSILVNDIEEYFVTSSTDGSIKIWDLVTLDKRQTFLKEGSRKLFKGDSGVSDMHLSFKNSLLYSVTGGGIVRCRHIGFM